MKTAIRTIASLTMTFSLMANAAPAHFDQVALNSIETQRTSLIQELSRMTEELHSANAANYNKHVIQAHKQAMDNIVSRIKVLSAQAH